MKERTGYVENRTTVSSDSYTYSSYDFHVKNVMSIPRIIKVYDKMFKDPFSNSLNKIKIL